MNMGERNSNATGAIDWDACPTRTPKLKLCRCAVCEICGARKHTGIHGPSLGELPGSKPWGHEFQTKEESLDTFTHSTARGEGADVAAR